VGGKSFKSKKKRNWVGGGEKIKFPKKNTEIRGKKNWEGGGKKIKSRKKLRSGLRKGKQKQSTRDGTGIEKRILSVHHPSTLVHWWVLIHSGPYIAHQRMITVFAVQCFCFQFCDSTSGFFCFFKFLK